MPGWDCHGLPIELKVLQSMKSKEREGLTRFTKKAAGSVETMGKQRESFKRYGIWGDWDSPYMTLQPEYEAAQIRVFGEMVTAGHIYRGKKPVHWSPSSRTALAEAELEYPENHVSKSIYLGFKVVESSDALSKAVAEAGVSADVRVAIWTTTPWTIPANLAVAVNPDIDYCLASHPDAFNGATFLVAQDLVGSLASKLGLVNEGDDSGSHDQVLVSRARPIGTTYQHLRSQSKIIAGGDYITTDSGTGLVHTAPATARRTT